jgi:carbonic anhydrase
MTQVLEPSTSEEDSEDPAAEEQTEVAAEPVVRVPPAPRSRRELMLLAGVPAATLLVAGGMGYVAGRATGGASAVDDSHAVFTYDDSKTGPEHWGEIGHGNSACATGNEQSPIDIAPRRLQGVDWLEPVSFKYKPSRIKVVHTGHTFQVNYEPGSRMTFMGREYELAQLHFHTPGEHLVNGRGADMEVHLVHQTLDASKTLAVLGLMVNAGAENALLARLWERMPDKPGKEVATPLTLDVTEVLPQGRDYWTYSGSETMPPCNENVTWILLKQPIQASRQQISRLTEVFGKNARPVQPLKERFVLHKAAPLA